MKGGAKDAPSKGYAFVTFTEHQSALNALRKLNNNPEVSDIDRNFSNVPALVKVLVSKNIFTPKYDLLIPKRIIVSGPHKGNFYKNQQEYITSYSVLEIFRGLSKSNIIWYSFYTLT